MTEVEAKTKICPLFRIAILTQVRQAGESEMPVMARLAMCSGSACMMWRYDDRSQRDGMFAADNGIATGFCGLAGKLITDNAGPV